MATTGVQRSAEDAFAARSPYEPSRFEHGLDPELFTSDRLDALCREADRRGTLKVQFADPGRQRQGNEPVYTKPSYPILEDVLRRPIQYRIMEVASWGGPEYADAFERVFRAGGPDPALGRVDATSVVRVFSPGTIVALHGDPDLKLVCDISGETVWYVRHPNEMSNAEHENLLRGKFFLQWRDAPEEALHIPPGWGCFVPSRWAHWLSHPGDEPAVSFELGFWTLESVRVRKVYDVNWLLRKAGLDPSPPQSGRDELKGRIFDTVSVVTRRGGQYRGI